MEAGILRAAGLSPSLPLRQRVRNTSYLCTETDLLSCPRRRPCFLCRACRIRAGRGGTGANREAGRPVAYSQEQAETDTNQHGSHSQVRHPVLGTLGNPPLFACSCQRNATSARCADAERSRRLVQNAIHICSVEINMMGAEGLHSATMCGPIRDETCVMPDAD